MPGSSRGCVARATDDIPDALRADLDRGSHAAQAGYQKLRDFLADELLPQAPEADAVGREKYPALVRRFLGADIDLDETYDWGQEELARIAAQMERRPTGSSPGASVREAIEILDTDPARRLPGTDALQAWMQERPTRPSTRWPTRISTSPSRSAGSSAGSPRPTPAASTTPARATTSPGRAGCGGRCPTGVTEFSHLARADHRLPRGRAGASPADRARRSTAQPAQQVAAARLAGSSGHGEGWALYAERLMADLGFLDDPGDRLGHARRPVAARGPGGDRHRRALRLRGPGRGRRRGRGPTTRRGRCYRALQSWTEGFLRFELERYLGWPGQAPSYKLGERLWLELRDAAKAKQGADFDLKQFHRDALNVGSVGLDVLRRAVLNEL